MKHFENNEIEVLLKKLAETERAQRSRSIVQDSAKEHLDPDELSSFAEGRLPAATRSFYMAHLAACDRCRGIVAQLATASGVGSALREPAVEQRWWSFLTKFFSPTVMRYAMPTLVVVVLAVAVFVWLQRESTTRMALRKNSEPAAEKVNNESNRGQLADRSSDSTASSNSSVGKSAVPSEAHKAKAEKDNPAAKEK